MYLDAVTRHFSESARLTAICDRNKGRMRFYEKSFKEDCPQLKCYLADDFDKMIAEQKPDAVIVCTMDSAHDDYICRAMNAGCDVITEKPMTVDEKKCLGSVDTA